MFCYFYIRLGKLKTRPRKDAVAYIYRNRLLPITVTAKKKKKISHSLLIKTDGLDPNMLSHDSHERMFEEDTIPEKKFSLPSGLPS